MPRQALPDRCRQLRSKRSWRSIAGGSSSLLGRDARGCGQWPRYLPIEHRLRVRYTDSRMTATDQPLVSIFMFVRNGGNSLRRAIDSVMAQTYSNIEFVVQDAVSTDGTLDLLRSYGDRIKIVSEPDSGPSEGLWRAMNRCTGEFVGSCLADEELMPDAVERAVRAFQEDPSTGAITGDALITDIDGKVTGSWTSGPFSLVDYLLADYSPYFVSSFFRRDVLSAVGLQEKNWNLNCVEFELWCRIASHAHVQYVPSVLAKYAQHPGQLSNSHH